MFMYLDHLTSIWVRLYLFHYHFLLKKRSIFFSSFLEADLEVISKYFLNGELVIDIL